MFSDLQAVIRIGKNLTPSVSTASYLSKSTVGRFIMRKKHVEWLADLAYKRNQTRRGAHSHPNG